MEDCNFELPPFEEEEDEFVPSRFILTDEGDKTDESNFSSGPKFLFGYDFSWVFSLRLSL